MKYLTGCLFVSLFQAFSLNLLNINISSSLWFFQVKAEVLVQSTKFKSVKSWESTKYCKPSKSSRDVADLPTLFANACNTGRL